MVNMLGQTLRKLRRAFKRSVARGRRIKPTVETYGLPGASMANGVFQFSDTPATHRFYASRLSVRVEVLVYEESSSYAPAPLFSQPPALHDHSTDHTISQVRFAATTEIVVATTDMIETTSTAPLASPNAFSEASEAGPSSPCPHKSSIRRKPAPPLDDHSRPTLLETPDEQQDTTLTFHAWLDAELGSRRHQASTLEPASGECPLPPYTAIASMEQESETTEQEHIESATDAPTPRAPHALLLLESEYFPSEETLELGFFSPPELGSEETNSTTQVEVAPAQAPMAAQVEPKRDRKALRSYRMKQSIVVVNFLLVHPPPADQPDLFLLTMTATTTAAMSTVPGTPPSTVQGDEEATTVVAAFENDEDEDKDDDYYRALRPPPAPRPAHRTLSPIYPRALMCASPGQPLFRTRSQGSSSLPHH
ncbi:hypothetical protein BGZ73_006502 [Actinomortierella ambigua]|nr:hypothetical protein BGZ73_006502 [Actinomortierella ambigua]